MAAVSLSNSPITQVSQTPVQTNLQPQLLTRLLLDLRGKRFSVDRETIMNLPDSVLLCLFPNGLVLSRQSAALSDGGDNDDYEELYGVDVSGDNHSWFTMWQIIPRTSLTQNVSPTSSRFSETHLKPSMGPQHHLGYLPLSSIWSREAHQLLTSGHPLHKILCSQSKLSLFSARSWNIFPYHPKIARPSQTGTELLTMPSST